MYTEIERLYNQLDWDMPEKEFNRVFDLILSKAIEFSMSADANGRKKILDFAYRNFIAQSLGLAWWFGPTFRKGTEGKLLSEHPEMVVARIREVMRSYNLLYKLIKHQPISIEHFHEREYVGLPFNINLNPAFLLRWMNGNVKQSSSDFERAVFLDPDTPSKLKKSQFCLDKSGNDKVSDVNYFIRYKTAVLVNTLRDILKSQGENSQVTALCNIIEDNMTGLLDGLNDLEENHIIFRLKEVKEQETEELSGPVEMPEEKEKPETLSEIKRAFKFELSGMVSLFNDLLLHRSEHKEEEYDSQIGIVAEIIRDRAGAFVELIV